MLIQLAFLPALISFFVLVSWIFQWPSPLALSPEGPFMVFNTALSLLLLSLSFLAFHIRELRLFRNAWLASLTLSILSGAQILFDVNLAIEPVFMTLSPQQGFKPETQIPGAVVFCLFFASFGWGTLQFHRQSRVAAPLAAFTAFCSVLFLGLIMMAHAVLLAPMKESWQSFSKVAFHTAFSFVILSLIGLLRSLHLLKLKDSGRALASASLCGLSCFFLGLLAWQYSLEKETPQVELKFQKEIAMRTEKMTALLQEQAEEFSRLRMPQDPDLANHRQWHPAFPAEMVIRRQPHLQVIWQKHADPPGQDLKLVSEQVEGSSGFRFHPNFYSHRQRWFAFSDNRAIAIFSARQIMAVYFPDELFSYSVLWKEHLLFSNRPGHSKALMEMEKTWPLEFEDAELTFQIAPTRQLYQQMRTSKPLHFLLASVALSVISAFLFMAIQSAKKRISR